MRRVILIIPVLFLWLAGLTVIVHMIIPHDHHLYDIYSYPVDKCPTSEKNTGHRPGIPVNCNSLNDLASEKLKPIQILQNIKFSFITFSILIDTPAFKLQSSCISLIDFSKSILDSYILEFSLLRAPPALA